MAIPTALLAKVLGGLGVLATAATVISVTANKSKDRNTQEKPKRNPKLQSPQSPTPEEALKALNDKIKSLGITDCELVKNESSKTCTLDKEKIKNVKFDGKTEGASVSEGASLNLKIEKGYESFVIDEKSTDLHFPKGIRFIFKNTSDSNDITIGNSPKQITFKSKTTYDYKIKTEKNKEDTLAKAIDLPNLVNEVGLNCSEDTINEGCSLTPLSLNIWKNENDYLTKGGAAATGSTNKKMKVTKDSSGYRQGLKFYFDEEEDLSGDNNKRIHLNPNTNYEIDIREVDVFMRGGNQKVKKWFLVDKTNEDLNEKIKGLGITNCKLENGQTKTSECELDETKVKAINFSNKPEGSDLTVTGLDQSKKLVLVIERDYKNTDFPSGLRFTFTNKNNEEVTIGSSDNSPVTLKGNTSYDFKIKDNTKLEKAWTLTTLAAKVGLTCTDTETNPQCDISTEGLNFWTSNTDYLTQLKNSENNKKITVTKDQQNYFEGLKFTVSQDITLTASTNPTKSLQLTSSSKSYEISPKEVSGTKKWFLIEKTNT